MNAKQLFSESSELGHKVRTQDDLINHIGTTGSSSANYSLFLGSGCSVSSGVRSGGALVDKWMLDLYQRFEGKKADSVHDARAYIEKHQTSWYNSRNPYSSLFEKIYDLPSQRRRFIESEVDRKLPSIGYAYLASLADQGYLRNIFTTNFDDLINEAFYQFSTSRPIVCAHDSSVHSILVSSSRPKIIKLHGDYLFNDIKSSLRETESLEQNTRDKMIEFCKEFGLIVVGYSGNDRSVMDTLDFLTKQENYLNNGLYWCFRETDEVNQDLQKLLWNEKVYPVMVDGFDQFLASTQDVLCDTTLGIETSVRENKLQQTLSNILEDKHGLAADPVIKEQIRKIKSQNDRQDLTSLLSDVSLGKQSQSSTIGQRELRSLLEIESLLKKGKPEEAHQKCEKLYYDVDTNSADKVRFGRRLVSICKVLGDSSGALRWAEKLVENDSWDESFRVVAANCIHDVSIKLSYCEDIKLKFPNSHIVLNLYSETALSVLRESESVERKAIDAIFEALDKSLTVEPSLRNAAWKIKLSVIDYCSKHDVEHIRDSLEDVVDKAKGINENSVHCLELMVTECTSSKNKIRTLDLITKLYKQWAVSSEARRESIDHMLCKLVGNLPSLYDLEPKDYRPMMKKFFTQHVSPALLEKSPELAVAKCRYFLGQEKNEAAARELLKITLDMEGADEELVEIIELSAIVDTGNFDKIQKMIDLGKGNFIAKYYQRVCAALMEAKGLYSEAISQLRQARDAGMSLSDYLTRVSYLYLLADKPKEVLALGEKYKDNLGLLAFDSFSINYQAAAKLDPSSSCDKSCLANLATKKHSLHVQICSFSIRELTIDAKKLIGSEIDRDYNNYYMFRAWPAIPDHMLEGERLAA